MEYGCMDARTTDAQWSLFSLKSSIFGLGQLNSGAIGVFPSELSSPVLVQWLVSSLSMFSIIQPLFLQKSKPLYSLINMRQLHIFSVKPKLDMRLFVDFCVFPRFSMNLPELNLKLFWTAEENNFRFREKWGKHRNQQTISCQVFA